MGSAKRSALPGYRFSVARAQTIANGLFRGTPSDYCPNQHPAEERIQTLSPDLGFDLNEVRINTPQKSGFKQNGRPRGQLVSVRINTPQKSGFKLISSTPMFLCRSVRINTPQKSGFKLFATASS